MEGNRLSLPARRDDARRIILISSDRIFVPPFRGCRASERRCPDIPITRRAENFRLRLITERFPDDDLT